ncbi:MAG: SMP-30/gluconolactonase/LRE family protein [Acidobacteriota bacterium]
MTRASAADFSYSITVHSPALEKLIDPHVEIEVLAEGFQWSEGPVWIDNEAEAYLLFSDVPQNKIYRWSAPSGLSVFLDPAGFEGEDAGAFREPGTNGLIRFDDDHIIAANHGQRALSLINLRSLRKTTIVNSYQDKSLNSPNDVVMAGNGDLYFTDPPYGLKGINKSPLKELSFNGVYLRKKSGELKLVDNGLSYPNGIGLSPDETTLYVSVSDPQGALWMRYSLDATGMPIKSDVLYDVTGQAGAGLPDGLSVDAKGNIFATGPGGIYVFSQEAELLGTINLDRAAANCTFGSGDGTILYITAGNILIRVPTKTRGIRH